MRAAPASSREGRVAAAPEPDPRYRLRRNPGAKACITLAPPLREMQQSPPVLSPCVVARSDTWPDSSLATTHGLSSERACRSERGLPLLRSRGSSSPSGSFAAQPVEPRLAPLHIFGRAGRELDRFIVYQAPRREGSLDVLAARTTRKQCPACRLPAQQQQRGAWGGSRGSFAALFGSRLGSSDPASLAVNPDAALAVTPPTVTARHRTECISSNGVRLESAVRLFPYVDGVSRVLGRPLQAEQTLRPRNRWIDFRLARAALS